MARKVKDGGRVLFCFIKAVWGGGGVGLAEDEEWN